MKKLILSIPILILINVYAKDMSNPLPNWIDFSREKSDKSLPFHSIIPSPPPETFRLMAEYEKAKAVVLGWSGYSTMLGEIARIAASEGQAEVWVLEGPDTFSSIPANRYIQVNCPLDTVWMRDYGPFGLVEKSRTVGVVDSIYRHYSYRRNDDQAPTCLSRAQNLEAYAMNLILDGGNLMVDRHGNLFMTKRTYDWNKNLSKEQVDKMLKEYFNVKNIHSIDYAGYPSYPTDGTGHIDMFVKLLGDDTVLIAEADTEPYKSTCQKAFDYFKNIKAPSGNDYKIIRVKGWSTGRTWYTYTNSLIVNNVVLVPSYATFQAENEKAMRAYQEALPNYKIRLINSDSSITSGGAIHCVTQLIPEV